MNKQQLKTLLLNKLPFIAKYRYALVSSYKNSLRILRYLPGGSLLYGPPRGIYASFAEYEQKMGGRLAVKTIVLKKTSEVKRHLPNTNSALVRDKFLKALNAITIEKVAYVLTNGRYIYGDGGTVITSDDKIFLPVSPLKNEWDIQKHQSLYKFKLPKATNFDKVIVIDTRASENNYYHWLKDHTSRFFWLKQLGLELSQYTLIASSGNLPYQQFVYQRLKEYGFNFKQVISNRRIPHILAKELIIPPYTTPTLVADQVSFTVEEADFINSLFLDRGSDGTATYNKIFISRRRSIRSSPQEIELAKWLVNYGVTEVFLEDYNIDQQAQLFNKANVIIGFHGAAFTNLFFCRQGTKVFEIFGADFVISEFWVMANELGLDHYAFCSDEFYKGITAYRLAREAPTLVNLELLKTYLKDNGALD